MAFSPLRVKIDDYEVKILPALTEKALKEKLRGSATGVYLIYGEEGYLKKIYTDKIVSKCVDKSFADFNFHTFEGDRERLPEIYDSVMAVPLMAQTTCVLVTDMPFDTFDDEGFAQLEGVLSQCPEECALIFVTLANNPSGEKWNKAMSLFNKFGFTVRFDKKTTDELLTLLESGAKKRGSAFARGAAQYMVECVGSDLSTLLNETEKLCAYAGKREITKADIDEVCVKSVEATAFEMIKALKQGRFDVAFSKLDMLFYLHTEPNMILGALVSSYADTYRAKCAVTAGKKAEYIAEHYNYHKREFNLRNGATYSAKLSLESLRECIEILARADSEIKGSGIDNRIILEQTLVNLALTEGNKN